MQIRSSDTGKSLVTISREDWLAIGKMSGWIQQTAADNSGKSDDDSFREVDPAPKYIPTPEPKRQPFNDEDDEDRDEEAVREGIEFSKDRNIIPNFNFGAVGNKILISTWKGESNVPRIVFKENIPNEQFREFLNTLYKIISATPCFTRPYYCKLDVTSCPVEEVATRIKNAAELQDHMIEVVGAYSSPEKYQIFKNQVEQLQGALLASRTWMLIGS